jgi:hypothetical protein
MQVSCFVHRSVNLPVCTVATAVKRRASIAPEFFGEIPSSFVSVTWVSFEVLSAVALKSSVFWDVTPCSLVEVNRRFLIWALMHLYEGSDTVRAVILAGKATLSRAQNGCSFLCVQFLRSSCVQPSCVVFGTCSFRIPVGTPAILPFRHFSRSLRAIFGVVPRLNHVPFLPRPFKFIDHHSSNDSTLCSSVVK